MVAEVTPGKDSFLVGSKKQILDRRVTQNAMTGPAYDIFGDGQRVIVAAVKPQPMHAQLTLITNWTAELSR